MKRTDLERLARLYGVNVEYVDVWGHRRATSPEAMLRTLQLLGAPLARAGDAAEAIRKRRQDCWQRILEPVFVAWEGSPAALPLRLPSVQNRHAWRYRLDLEDGGRVESSGTVDGLRLRALREVEGVRYAARLLDLAGDLPRGYHRLTLEVGDREAECLVIAAPRRVYADAARGPKRLWGVFLPLYALFRESSWGAGDFSDLEALMQWTADQGGSLVATLPLLATLWELTDDPSPYNPASRLFWNEFYLDPRQTPEFESCPAARALVGTLDDLRREAGRRPAGLIDYGKQMRFKRQMLEALAATFFESSSPRRDALARHCRENPELESFARFRAAGERQGAAWPAWPEPLRSGALSPGDYDDAVYRYHLYAQWQVEQQLRSMTDRADRLDLLWYLDFPLGVSGQGYDVWRERDLFVRGAAAGAPPDAFFTKGQNWGFPPLNPDALRRQGYRYFIKALRNHLQHARVLRLDHVMGLYRFYWIPHGLAADDGAYVRYPVEEFFAILALESHRVGARIVGENLGTVPARVDEALRRHGVDDMYVLQYETNPDKGPTLRSVPATAVASLNTHDMPQFAAYWKGLDVDDRVDLGLLTPEQAAAERVRRERLRRDLVGFFVREKLLEPSQDPSVPAVLEACQAYLARSRASVVLVNLEDLWAETEPQNVPGTYRERPNWRRRARYSFETFSRLPAVRRILASVDRLRRRASAEAAEEEDDA